jgi:hypothetical protein
MSASSTYSVFSTGQIKLGHEPASVQSAFAELFKITPDKALPYINEQRLLKKGLTHPSAQAFINHLEQLGLEVTLEENKPEVVQPSISTLSLVPMDEERGRESSDGSTATGSTTGSTTGLTTGLTTESTTDSTTGLATGPTTSSTTISTTSATSGASGLTCPKCQLEQTNASQCAGCGVYFDKVSNQESDDPEQVNSGSSRPGRKAASRSTTVITRDKSSSTGVLALGVGAVVALLGAWVWKLIAVNLGFEFGMVAWVIGGAIGFAAAVVGSRGEVQGTLCGILTIMAILGGKYLTIETVKSEWQLMAAGLSDVGAEVFQEAYEQDLAFAEQYVNEVNDDRSLREFIIEYGYSDADDADAVTFDEITAFKSIAEQPLKTLHSNDPGLEQWLESSYKAQFEAYSTFDLIKEDFGIVDVLFLSLGVASAFRLGRGNAH